MFGKKTVRAAFGAAIIAALAPSMAFGTVNTLDSNGEAAQVAKVVAGQAVPDIQTVAALEDDPVAAWAGETPCEACHAEGSQPAMQNLTENDEAEKPTDSPKAFSHATDFECIICHADDALVEIHDGLPDNAKLPKRLKQTAVSASTCLACHEADDTDAPAPQATGLMDDENTVVDPHDLPDVESHQSIVCSSCHTIHSESDAEQAASQTCQKCHHKNVFSCFSCHE